MGDITFPQNYKIFWILYNLAYAAIGGVMIGLGATYLVDILALGAFTQNDFVAASSLFIAVGVLKVVIGIMGNVIYFIKWKPLFAIYIIAAILLMLTTYAAAIVGFLSRPGAHDTLVARLDVAYSNTTGASPIGTNNTDEILNLQQTLNCCGPERAFSDVIGNCNSTRPMNTVFGRGCLQFLSDAVLDPLYNLGAVGMAFGSFELTSFLIAIQHTEGSGL